MRLPFPLPPSLADEGQGNGAKKEKVVNPSMQPEFAIDGFKLGWLDQLAVGDLDRMQRTFELLLPKLQKALQFGEVREKIVILPNVGLEEPMMVRPPIKNVRCGQTKAINLLDEIWRNHFRVLRLVGQQVSIPAPSIANRNSKQAV